MARDTSPQCKQCRREGQKLFLKGERCFTDKCGVERRSYPPGDHGRGRLRQSEYRLQLREKQKTRRYYQVLEKQFRAYYEHASRQEGVTGENLLRLLESRFDNVLVRLGFAASRRQARQLINHGHWLINGRRVDIPSYQVRPEDIISIKADLQRDRHGPPRDGIGFDGPGLAAGRPRRPDRQGPALPRAQRDLGAGPGAADRRAVLQVVRTRRNSEKKQRKELMTTDFQVPRITAEKVDDRRGTFTIEPLDKGFGYTFGNSLRRVLLSSLGGAAITSVRIEGVAHEFSTVPGVKEDVTDIVLNLKDLVVRMHTDADEVEAPLVATGPGEVKAKDIDLPSGVEILNPEAPIATLEKKTKLEVYLTIGRGRGYSPAEENKSDEQPIGVIPIDSIFSPIRRASYAVSGARVGQRTDFDKLELDLETDGSIEPGAALREASEILIKSLAIFTDADRVEELTAREPVATMPADGIASNGAGEGGGANNGLDEILIEELELGVRSYNCLKRAGVQTVGDLVRKSRAELNAIPNFGSEVDRGSDRDAARPRPRSPAGLKRFNLGPGTRAAEEKHSASQHEAQQAES